MYKVDVYLRVRRAVMVDGMSIREASRVFGLHRDTVRKMLVFSVPPGYLRQSPPKRPKLEPYTGVIDRILEDDLGRPRKQRHTAKRIFERLGGEYGFDGGYTTVKDYVSRDSPDQTNFPGYSSFWDTVKYNPAFQGRQMRPDSLKCPVFI